VCRFDCQQCHRVEFRKLFQRFTCRCGDVGTVRCPLMSNFLHGRNCRKWRVCSAHWLRNSFVTGRPTTSCGRSVVVSLRNICQYDADTAGTTELAWRRDARADRILFRPVFGEKLFSPAEPQNSCVAQTVLCKSPNHGIVVPLGVGVVRSRQLMSS